MRDDMIISCEKCETKYRLDESRLSYSSVKVQCSKCDHIFIVTAAGEEKKKSGIQDNGPTGKGVAPEDKGTPVSESAPDTPPGIDEDKASDEPNEPADEKNKEESSMEEGSTDIGDFSFNASGDIPLTPKADDNETHRAVVEEEPSEDYEAPADERVPEPMHQQTAADESSDAATERDEPKGEEKRDTPLPWEVSANSFDLSFGKKEYKPQDEDRSIGFEGNDPEKKYAPHDAHVSHNLEEGDNESAEDIMTGDEEGDESTESSEPEFELKGLLEEADKASNHSENTGAEDGGDELNLAFNQKDITTAPADTITFDARETITETAAPNHTFSIPETPAEPEETKKTGIAGIIAIIIIIIAISGGLIYMKTRPESVIMAEPSGASPLEIESTKGYYVVNKDGGKIFVIETMLRNITDGPVKISGIRGLIMDSSGKELARKIVSPGRVVTDEDIRNLPVETLLKSFRDTSAGTMPKKSTIPTMILFTDLQKAVAEYGIDVLR